MPNYVAPLAPGPVIQNENPDLGSTVLPNQALEFEVYDPFGICGSVVMVKYGTTAYEVIHDGEEFASNYSVNSTRTAIPGGYAYSLRHNLGWPGDPCIQVFAINDECVAAKLPEEAPPGGGEEQGPPLGGGDG